MAVLKSVAFLVSVMAAMGVLPVLALRQLPTPAPVHEVAGAGADWQGRGGDSVGAALSSHATVRYQQWALRLLPGAAEAAESAAAAAGEEEEGPAAGEVGGEAAGGGQEPQEGGGDESGPLMGDWHLP